MAHEFECKRCGYQEAAHEFPQDYPGVCRSYLSPDKRAEKRLWNREKPPKMTDEESQSRYRIPGVMYWRT